MTEQTNNIFGDTSSIPDNIFDDAVDSSSTTSGEFGNNLDGESKEITEATPESTSTTAKKLYKLMIDGTEEEVDEDTLIKNAQKYKAADKRFNEAAATKKQMETIVNLLKTDPLFVLQELGIDPTELSRSHLEKYIQEQQMTPEQRELEQLRQEKAKYQEQYEKYIREQQEEQETQQRAALTDQYTKELISALEHINLPKTEATVAEMVKIMRQAISNDIDMSWNEAAQLVKTQLRNNYTQIFNGLSEEDLIDVIGKDAYKRLVKHSTKSMYQEKVPVVQPKSGAKAKTNNTTWGNSRNIWED